MQNKNLRLKLINLACFALTVAINSMASAYALNGRTTAEISDMYPTLITPAGITFSIWGLIYLMLGLFVVAPFFIENTEEDYLGKVGLAFALSCAFNIMWLLLWHYGYVPYSVIAMIGLFVSLGYIHSALVIGRSMPPLRERFIFHFPFSLYFGWVTVALMVNVATALVYVSWDRFGLSEPQWGLVAIGLTTVIALIFVFSKGDAVFSLAIIWALFGISIKPGIPSEISAAASISGVILILAILFLYLTSRASFRGASSSSTL